MNTQRRTCILYMTAMANHLLSWLLCPALAVMTPRWDLPFLFLFVTSFDVTVKMWNSLETLVPGSSFMKTCPRGAYKDGFSMSWLGTGGVCAARVTDVQPWAWTALSSPQPQELWASFCLWQNSLYQERGLGLGRSAATMPCYLFWAPLLPASTCCQPIYSD